MKYRLAVFDMDGTILYTLKDIVDGLNYALMKNNLPARDADAIRRTIGNGIRMEVKRNIPADCDAQTEDKVFADFNEWYAVHCADHTKPYDGIMELLARLKEAGMKTAVVSNKGDYAVQELNQTYFNGIFDAALGEKEGIAKKPAPDMIEAVLKKMDIRIQDAVYIGDSEVDIETARNAGMDCILVGWGYRDQEDLLAAGAKVIVASPEELYELL
ncbi:MAG: HAD-IIIA family hydrolase [Solobacterium sp.]|nr:HAD-IIIA family hydrolase [Solobacterium sp.]